jgi:predicted RNase H-like HicB family nuclease
MTYNVLVRNNPNGRYEATILGWPDCTLEGSSRQDVVQRARELLADLLAE